MINSSKYSIAKIVPLVVLFLVFSLGFYLFSESNYLKRSKQEKVDTQKSITEFLRQLRDRWERGDSEGEIDLLSQSCADIPKVHGQIPDYFFQCNSAYLKCFISSELENEGKSSRLPSSQMKFLKNQSHFDSQGTLILNFMHLQNDISFAVKFDNYCHQTYLPRRVYSAGIGQNIERYWDNFNQDIFIDKYYVNRYEVQKWKTKFKEDKVLKDGYLPALNLSLREMKQFCFDHGKKLLENRVFDASAFFPSPLKDGYIFKARYPWGNEKSKKDFSTSVSWNGVFFVLGGEMEVFNNVFDKRGNLKVSNSHLPIESKWNRNGVRAYWSGESDALGSFDFSEFYSGRRYDILKTNGVAFRCMTQR